MTLRARLALLFGALGLLVSVLVGALAFRATETELTAATDSFLTARAAEIAGGTRGSPGQRDGNGANRSDAAPRLPFDADAISQVVKTDGEVSFDHQELPITANTQEMIDLEPGRRDQPVVRFDDIEVGGESHRMVSQALAGGGAVQVARSTVETDDVLSALIVRFAIISGIVALVGALLGWLIARRTTAPLRRLTEVAADVAETRDFTTDIDVDRADEIGHLAASLRTMLDALETSREQQYQLVHDAGHELRTPLTSLRANIELLERAPDLGSEERDEVVTAIKSEVIELSELFTELIDLATDQHDASVELVPIELGSLVVDVVDRWRRRLDRPIDVETSSAVVLGDEAMLERALANLLANAHKFSPAGTPIEVVAQDGRISVSDHGPGVPADDRSRIFDRFYRTAATRSMPGSGLGLAIVSQIVERHGGRVFVDESTSGGADIGFVLPLVEGRTVG